MYIEINYKHKHVLVIINLQTHTLIEKLKYIVQWFLIGAKSSPGRNLGAVLEVM